MKLLPLIPLLIALLTLLFRVDETPSPQQYIVQKKLTAISCIPERSRAMVEDGIGILPGTGKHHWKVSDNDSAQIYFDQGMNMFYSFHIIESLASFVKAQRFDPENAMLYWGEALTYSPNINDVGYVQPPDALKAVENAKRFSSSRNDTEQGLINAMHARYSPDPSANRQKLNERYRDAMASLAAKNAGNADVQALYADALMVMHPWDLYHGDGQPKPWTPQLVRVLEKGLNVSKDHPGLNHYYIHAVEGSSTPGRGLKSADKLADIVPGAAHMVHMPSHIYIRTGDYGKGIDVNVKALNGYESYRKIYPNVVNGAFLYQFHNTHLMAACAMMNGNYAVALKTSEQCAAEVPLEYHSMEGPLAEFMQYITATPIFANIRYGKWDELLKERQVADSSIYLRILNAFGRGFAHARKGNVGEAEKELALLTGLMESQPKLKERAFNTAYDGANVGKHMLAGAIAEQKKDYDRAEILYSQASELEANMVYNEPKDWVLPPLPYLGNVQLKMNKFKEAEKTFLKDLSYNPNNCWSLKGLHLAQVYLGKNKAASETFARLKKATENADIKLSGPVF